MDFSLHLKASEKLSGAQPSVVRRLGTGKSDVTARQPTCRDRFAGLFLFAWPLIGIAFSPLAMSHMIPCACCCGFGPRAVLYVPDALNRALFGRISSVATSCSGGKVCGLRDFTSNVEDSAYSIPGISSEQDGVMWVCVGGGG